MNCIIVHSARFGSSKAPPSFEVCLKIDGDTKRCLEWFPTGKQKEAESFAEYYAGQLKIPVIKEGEVYGK